VSKGDESIAGMEDLEVSEVRGRDILLEVLASEGVRYVFGNPGTTELPFMDSLAGAPQIEYLLALHESVAIGMADGYAQVTRRPAFVNLHTAPGLGNAVGTLANAAVTRTPMVVTAGQQDRRHLLAEPFLSGDLVEIAASVTKWARQVHAVEDLGTTMRRAFHDAASVPTGPVFVALPMDLLEETAHEPLPPPTPIRRRVVPAELGELPSEILGALPGGFAIVAGDEVARSQAVEALVDVAEGVGAPVFGTPLHSNTVFPTAHPLWRGALTPESSAIHGTLAEFRCVLLIGGRGFMTFPFVPGPVVPSELSLLHLSPDPADLGRTYPARLAMVGDPRATLERLAPMLRDGIDAAAIADRLARAASDGEEMRSRLEVRMREMPDSVPARPEVAAHAILRALPPNTVVVEESPTADAHVRAFHRVTEADRFFYSRGGGLGWGMAAALGVSLGLDGEPVVCMVGDGSAMYAPQSLWSAARLGLPVVFVVFNNRRYQILRRFLEAMEGESRRTGRYVGMDIADPPIDFPALAGALGIEATTVERASEAAEAVSFALNAGGAKLVEIPVVPE
jgi:benzoylformate decarboxylase